MAIKKQLKKITKKTVKKIGKQQGKPVKAKKKKSAEKKSARPAVKKRKLLASRVQQAKGKKVILAPAKVKKVIAQEKQSPEEKKEALRKFLLQIREQLVKEAKTEISKYIRGETRQLVDTALDDGDWSIVDLSEDISLRQLGTHREKLVKIDESLRKLAEGTYGICESCGEEINEKRLKVMPFAIYCRDCQEKIEQMEAIEKEP
ncbi:MAG: TraR/DksA family transcriptional regulator [Nitrospirae bacterium]|nr:MAG: TraR/DksA family transcriptional regulator [Nitrospirota bacterium]